MKARQFENQEDLDMLEIESNSFLDFPTVAKSPKKPQSQTTNGKAPEETYEMMTEINNDGELLINYEILIPNNHPILNLKVNELEKSTSGCLLSMNKAVSIDG